METPLLVITAIVATGLVFVVIPIGLDVYRRFRHRKVIFCPGTHQMAEVMPKTWDAVVAAILAKKPIARVKWCSLWPKRRGCDEKCMKENWPTR